MARLPKIAVYTMAKNEARNVARYMETTAGADYVCVTDTGSTDDTPMLLKNAGARVFHSAITPWRFDTATNCALCHVPTDVDICVKLDMDEVLHTTDSRPWRSVLDELWTKGTFDQLQYWYVWNWKDPGKQPGARFYAKHIHARVGFTWRHPGHASLNFVGKPKLATTDKLQIHHYMENKHRPDYLALLTLAVQENRCPRTLYYLGREHFFRKQSSHALSWLQAYLQHPDAKWAVERAQACCMIGFAYLRVGDTAQGLRYMLQANAECPNVREIWWQLLLFFYGQKDWAGGVWAGTRCLQLETREPYWIGQDGEAWYEQPYVLTARCALQLGDKTYARRLCQTAQKINPEHPTVVQLTKEVQL